MGLKWINLFKVIVGVNPKPWIFELLKFYFLGFALKVNSAVAVLQIAVY